MSDQPRIEQILGNEFWTQPEGVLREAFALMYSQILQAYREELSQRTASIMDYQLVERVAFTYAFLRQREADADNLITDRNRREMMKDWTELCIQLKKLWNLEDKEAQSEVMMKKLDKIISPILDDLPDTPENRSLKKQFALGLESL